MEGMEYIDLRKVGRAGPKEIRRQVVRLKELGKMGKEIEELAGVRQNRANEIWTAYQREGSASLERKKYGRKPGSHMVLTPEEQENVRKTIVEKVPEEFGITYAQITASSLCCFQFLPPSFAVLSLSAEVIIKILAKILRWTHRASIAKLNCARPLDVVVAQSGKRVRLMWKEKVPQALRIALCLLWVLYILTTKAC